VNIYTCVYMQLYNFRDGHVTTFRHPICQMPGHRLSGLRHTIRVSAFHRYRWFGLKLFPYAVHRIVEGYPKTRKNAIFAIFGSGSAHTTKFRNVSRYHPSSPPLWRFASEIAAIRRLGLGLHYKYYKNVVLVWPGAAHTPIAV